MSGDRHSPKKPNTPPVSLLQLMPPLPARAALFSGSVGWELHNSKSLCFSMEMKTSRRLLEEELFRQLKERRSEDEDDATASRRKSKVADVLDHDDAEEEDDGYDEDKEEEEDDLEEEEGKREQHSHRRVTHGYHLVEGRMNHRMEDFLVAENRKVNGYDLGLYAIFDGHSSRKVAEYLQGHLFDNILSEPDFWRNPRSAIQRAYSKTDKQILDNVVGSRGGSTAVTAILVNGTKLIVANVGDSRAVLCRNGKVKPITMDHEPEKERELVDSKGGFVSKKPGNVPRVDGQLAMTRAFGDEKLKEHITSEPDIFVETIDSDTEFIILASDGLWKVMSNEDALECIMEVEDAQEASEELIRAALARKSADDISCVVVRFD